MGGNDKKYIYLRVTLDEYELPVAVADTARELAAITGYSEGSIYSMLCRGQHGFARVEVSENDND